MIFSDVPGKTQSTEKDHNVVTLRTSRPAPDPQPMIGLCARGREPKGLLRRTARKCQLLLVCLSFWVALHPPLLVVVVVSPPGLCYCPALFTFVQGLIFTTSGPTFGWTNPFKAYLRNCACYLDLSLNRNTSLVFRKKSPTIATHFSFKLFPWKCKKMVFWSIKQVEGEGYLEVIASELETES